MKKVIALILATVMLLAFSACDGETEQGINENGAEALAVFAEERSLNTEGAVSEVNSLSNTYYRLTEEKDLTIGYFGGSVTAGMSATEGNAWTDNITKWFGKKFSSAQINVIDAAEGNRSSLWGYFRIDEDLIAKNPDLVFIELAINDMYQGFTGEGNAFFTEGIISKIRSALPQTEIVMVLITDETLETDYTALQTHIKLAEHYGIPYINVGKALADEISKTGGSYKDYIVDNVHPNDKGHKIYSDCIAEYLQKTLIDNPVKTGGVSNLPLPANDLASNGTKASEIITASQISEMTDVSDWTVMRSPSNNVRNFGPSLYGLDGASFTVDFEGRALCAMVDAKQGSVVKCTIDGRETVSVQVPNDIRAEICIADNLSYGKHTATIEVVTDKRFIFGAILVAR